MKRMIELENQILQDQIQLNHLMEEAANGQLEPMAKLKLDRMQQEIWYLQQQMQILRENYVNQPAGMQQNPAVQNMPSQGTVNPAMQNMPSQGTVNPAMQNVSPQRTVPQGSQMQPQYQAPKQDMEKAFGKTVMAICASILIFISIVSIATLVIANMSDTVKMVLMFVISFAFTAVGGGLLLWKKENKWFLSLTGCGVGALYISLLCGSLYFNRISETGLFIGIFVWAVFVCVLSRLRSNVFLVIGQMGAFIAVLLGLVLCNITSDSRRLLMLLVFYIVTEAVFFISHFRKQYGKNLVNLIFMTVGFLFMLIGTNSGYAQENVQGAAASILLCFVSYVLVVLGMTVFEIRENENIGFGIISLVQFCTACWAIGGYFADMHLLILIAAALTLVLLELTVEKRAERKPQAGNILFQIVLFIFIFGALCGMEILKENVFTFPALAACFIYGFLRKNTVYKTAGMVYTVLFLFAPMNGVLHLFFEILIAAGMLLLLWKFKEQYRTWIKLVIYVLFEIALIVDLWSIMDEWDVHWSDYEAILLITILSLVNIAMMKIPCLCRDIRNGKEEKGIFITTGIINIIMMLLVMARIQNSGAAVEHVWAILLGLVLFFVNSWNLIKKYNSGAASVYVGIKLLIYVLIVLGSFKTPGYLLSMAGLATVLLCIVFGFVAERKMRRNFKAVRIYGLVLALICMLKLILIDISYESVLMQAVSFFISGILCFGISFIYHLVDKAVIKKVEIEEKAK